MRVKGRVRIFIIVDFLVVIDMVDYISSIDVVNYIVIIMLIILIFMGLVNIDLFLEECLDKMF